MFLAAVYSCHRASGGTAEVAAFAIVTHTAIAPFKRLSSRPPVILCTVEHIQAWLDTSSGQWTEKMTEALLPTSHEKCPLEYFEVSSLVNEPEADGPALTLPVSPSTLVTRIPPPPPPPNEPAAVPKKVRKRNTGGANPSSRVEPSMQPDESQLTLLASANPSSTAQPSTSRKRKALPSQPLPGLSKKDKTSKTSSAAPSAVEPSMLLGPTQPALRGNCHPLQIPRLCCRRSQRDRQRCYRACLRQPGHLPRSSGTSVLHLQDRLSPSSFATLRLARRRWTMSSMPP